MFGNAITVEHRSELAGICKCQSQFFGNNTNSDSSTPIYLSSVVGFVKRLLLLLSLDLFELPATTTTTILWMEIELNLSNFSAVSNLFDLKQNETQTMRTVSAGGLSIYVINLEILCKQCREWRWICWSAEVVNKISLLLVIFGNFFYVRCRWWTDDFRAFFHFRRF